jgi:localization factor PodJL
VSVQSKLAQRGYYQGAIDGVIGSDSRQAIRAFQAAQGLPVTGAIDIKLLNALDIKYKTG